MDLKASRLTAFAGNKRTIHVYERLGFDEAGAVPKKHFKEGKYIEEITNTQLLEQN